MKLVFCLCAHCGKTVIKENKKVAYAIRHDKPDLFCDAVCAASFRSLKITKKCAFCHKTIHVIPKELSERNFCSRSCSASFNNRGRKVIGEKEATCISCGHSTMIHKQQAVNTAKCNKCKPAKKPRQKLPKKINCLYCGNSLSEIELEKYKYRCETCNDTIDVPQIKNENVIQWFEGKRIKHESGCIFWTGALDTCGYGQVHYKASAHMTTSRAAYLIYKGSIPKEKPYVLHTCDVRHCTNPEHLWIGTNDDNMKDMVSKGRASKIGPGDNAAKGEKVKTSKLDEIKVIEIRSRYEAGEYTSLRELAEEYDISKAAIIQLVQRKTWKHI